jgi:ankyrin repeat protein
MGSESEIPEVSYTPSDPQPADRLCQAVSQGDLAEVQRLLEAGVDVNARSTHSQWTPLMLTDSVDMVDLLLTAGADIQLEDAIGGDALFYALDRENEAVLARLLAVGADLNRRNKYGWTRLRSAAFGRQPQQVALLLRLGADPSLDRGKLLSAASWYGFQGYNEATEQTIDVLVAAGEDVHAADDHGYTALHCAVLDYAHTPSDEHWWNASSDGSDETATRALLKHGADPNAAGRNGMTPLLLAVQSSYGAKACVEALLAAGADLEKADPGGITPLMRAAYRGRSEHVSLLLEHGADAARTDRYGHGALYYAQRYLDHLRSEAKEQQATEAADDLAPSWYQEREKEVQLCIDLLTGSRRTPSA